MTESAEPRRVPMYQRIFDSLKERIVSGLYSAGCYLPSERELCGEFGVHRITVRKSLDMLTAEGLVEKFAGKGTMVSGGAKPDAPEGKPPLPLSGQKYIVFVLCADDMRRDRFTEPFQSALFYHLERRCAKLGYHLIYKTANAGDHIADIVKGVEVSALVFSSYTFEDLLAETLRLRTPGIIVNHGHPRFTSIQCDNFNAAREMTAYLLSTGHRRIAALTGRLNYETSRERLEGWKTALEKESIDYKTMPLYEGDWTFDCGCEAARKIARLEKSARPDAVFAFNDESAFGLIKTLQEAGISVPGDISVAGFDDTPACARVSPALSTVHVDIETVAMALIQQLYFTLQLSLRISPIVIRVPAYLSIRDSIKTNI